MNAFVEQGSREWHELRAGRITASEFYRVLGPAGDRETYKRELAFERLAGVPVHEVRSRSLEWGSEIEQFARQAYELRTGNFVERAGFVTHPVYQFVGASPDGFVGHDGVIEIKSPHSEAVHILTWLEGMPAEHIPQVQGGLWVYGRQWCDFNSFDPRILKSEKHRLYIQRIHRDEIYIARLAAAVIEFNDEVNDLVQLLEERAS